MRFSSGSNRRWGDLDYAGLLFQLLSSEFFSGLPCSCRRHFPCLERSDFRATASADQDHSGAVGSRRIDPLGHALAPLAALGPAFRRVLELVTGDEVHRQSSVARITQDQARNLPASDAFGRFLCRTVPRPNYYGL
jgi:hypothetical protein